MTSSWNLAVVDLVGTLYGGGVKAENHAWLFSHTNMHISAVWKWRHTHYLAVEIMPGCKAMPRCFVGVWDNHTGDTNQMVHMNILITCVFAAFLMGVLLAGLIVFCYRDSFLRKPRHVHKDAESAPSCSDSTELDKLHDLFDSPVKVQL